MLLTEWHIFHCYDKLGGNLWRNVIGWAQTVPLLCVGGQTDGRSSCPDWATQFEKIPAMWHRSHPLRCRTSPFPLLSLHSDSSFSRCSMTLKLFYQIACPSQDNCSVHRHLHQTWSNKTVCALFITYLKSFFEFKEVCVWQKQLFCLPHISLHRDTTSADWRSHWGEVIQA